MAIAPVLPWRKASGELLSQRLFWPAWAGTGAVVLAVVVGARGLAPLVAFGLGGFAAGAAVRQVVLASRRQGWRGLVGRTNGGMIVHLGVVMIAVAIAASGSYDTERELTLSEGESATVAGHEIRYVGLRTDEDDRGSSVIADVAIDGDVYAPRITNFTNGSMAVGKPSFRTGITRDVYLALLRVPETTDTQATEVDESGTPEGEAGDDDGSTPGPGESPGAAELAPDEAVIRVIVQPMVVWLWIGGIVMAIGTALAAFPGRRRRPEDPVSASVGEERSRRRLPWRGRGGDGDVGDGGDGAGDDDGTGGPGAPARRGTDDEPLEVGV
jgi:cytochrome c-type biogenesis protein CcmF